MQRVPVLIYSTGKDSDVEDPFIVWLRERLDGPKREWKKGLLVSIILPRVKALRGTLERLSDWGWERSQGGYQVPEGMQSYLHHCRPF